MLHAQRASPSTSRPCFRINPAIITEDGHGAVASLGLLRVHLEQALAGEARSCAMASRRQDKYRCPPAMASHKQALEAFYEQQGVPEKVAEMDTILATYDIATLAGKLQDKYGAVPEGWSTETTAASLSPAGKLQDKYRCPPATSAPPHPHGLVWNRWSAFGFGKRGRPSDMQDLALGGDMDLASGPPIEIGRLGAALSAGGTGESESSQWCEGCIVCTQKEIIQHVEKVHKHHGPDHDVKEELGLDKKKGLVKFRSTLPPVEAAAPPAQRGPGILPRQVSAWTPSTDRSGKLYAVQFAPDGRSFWTSGADGLVRQWSCPDDTSEDCACAGIKPLASFQATGSSLGSQKGKKPGRVDAIKFLPPTTREEMTSEEGHVSPWTMCTVDTERKVIVFTRFALFVCLRTYIVWFGKVDQVSRPC